MGLHTHDQACKSALRARCLALPLRLQPTSIVRSPALLTWQTFACQTVVPVLLPNHSVKSLLPALYCAFSPEGHFCVQRFGGILACASLGCTSGFLLNSLWLIPPVSYLAAVGLFSQGMLLASPLSCTITTQSLGAGSQMPSPTGTALQTAGSILLTEVSRHRHSAGEGALMWRTLASLTQQSAG